MVLCNNCGKSYANISSLNKHIRVKHENPQPRNLYTCSDCSSTFTLKSQLRKHVRENHVELPLRRKPQSKILCSDIGCHQLSFLSYKFYLSHLRTVHNLEIKEETLTFDSKADFEQWRSTGIPGTHYVKDFGARARQNKIVEYLRCNRSYSPNIKSGRRTKYCGSIKIGSACPSNMRVVYGPEKINVHFVRTHFGHSCDVSKVPLPKVNKRRLAQQSAASVPFERVLDDIQATADPDHDHILPCNVDLDNYDYSLEWSAKCQEILTLIHQRSCVGRSNENIVINRYLNEILDLLRGLPGKEENIPVNPVDTTL